MVLLWLFYLSLVVVGQVFLGYQWDSLLLEAGLLAVLLTPWRARLSRAGDQPWGFAIWLVRLLAVRLMFLSGMVKLASHDPTWRDWTALDYHYQTQPLPIWTSWYVHQMPAWFRGLSVGFMFYAELVAPFFVLGPRPIRLVGFASIVLLQILIAATGNYGFFNLLTVVICLTMLDDRDWGLVAKGTCDSGCLLGESQAKSVRRRNPATEMLQAADLVLAAASVRWYRGSGHHRRDGLSDTGNGRAGFRDSCRARDIESMVRTVSQYEHLRAVRGDDHHPPGNHRRRERRRAGMDNLPLPVETWRAGRSAATCLFAPATARLADVVRRSGWRLWRAPWFFRFEQRLLEGSPAVLGLLAENPFSDHPPRYVRARLYLYKFAQGGS